VRKKKTIYSCDLNRMSVDPEKPTFFITQECRYEKAVKADLHIESCVRYFADVIIIANFSHN
jgi:hypothetical protein